MPFEAILVGCPCSLLPILSSLFFTSKLRNQYFKQQMESLNYKASKDKNCKVSSRIFALKIND